MLFRSNKLYIDLDAECDFYNEILENIKKFIKKTKKLGFKNPISTKTLFVDDLIIMKENNTENQGKNIMNSHLNETSKMNSQSVKNFKNYDINDNDDFDLSFDIDSDTTYLFKIIRYETLYQPFLFLYHFIDEKLTNIVRTQCLENNRIRYFGADASKGKVIS